VSIDIIGWVVIGVIGLVVLWWIVTYNRMIVLRNRIENAWSQVDVQLRRRYDLIPNLVETVKGYAGHERSTFEEVTKARQAGIDARGVENQAQAEKSPTPVSSTTTRSWAITT